MKDARGFFRGAKKGPSQKQEDVLFDRFLSEGLGRIAQEVDVPKDFSVDIRGLKGREEKMKTKKTSRYVLVMAIVLCCISATAFAVGSMAGYIGHSTNRGTTMPTQEKMKEYLGEVPKVVSEFENGYKFVDYAEGENSMVDDQGEKLETVKEYMFGFEDATNPGRNVSLLVSQKFMRASEEDEKGVEDIEIGGKKAELYEMDYKFVPPNYELTAEDRKKQEDGVLEISYGSDKVEEEHTTIVSWEEGGLDYSLIYSGQYELRAQDLIEMAEEVIAK